MPAAPRAESAYSPGAHIPVLDGFRGLAVLLVVVRHASHYFRPNSDAGETLRDALGAGWIGVDLFFVLSGFLITGILVDSKGGPHYFRNFYIRRSLRIFPLYYGFLALIFFVLPQFYQNEGGQFEALQDRQVWYWTYLVNVLGAAGGLTPLNTTHLWSLAVEEQFYLVWPAVVLWCGRRRLAEVSIAMLATALVLRVVVTTFYENVLPQGAYMLTPMRMDALALGGLLALALRHPGGMERVRGLAPYVLAGATASMLILHVDTGGLDWMRDGVTQTVGFTIVAAFAVALLATVIVGPERNPLRRAIDARWLRALGKYSYAIYLFHYPLLNTVRYLWPMEEVPYLLGAKFVAQAVFTLALLLASFALAWLSWHVYEKHFLALKRFFPTGSPAGARKAETVAPAEAATDGAR